MALERIKRVTDLFQEGQELYLGDDDAGKPVVIWINKLNSFEDDECRRDGLAMRSEKLLELSDPDNAEMATAEQAAAKLDNDTLIDRIVDQHFDEDYFAALDDADLDKEWREKKEYLERTG